MDTETTVNLLPPVSLTQTAVLVVAVITLLGVARAVWGPSLTLSRRPVLWILRGLIFLVLAAILANPVEVRRSSGEVQRSDVTYLVDVSASMALGEGMSRSEHARQIMHDVDQLIPAEQRPNVRAYRFGQQLSAIESLSAADGTSLAPTESDTQLLSALRQLLERLSGGQHQAVVVLSDGRSREPVGVQEMARRYAERHIPIHVVPLGEADRGGDLAMVNMVVPARVRKHSEVAATVWLRSFGHNGVRTELSLEALSQPGQPPRPLVRLPITLTGGIQSFPLRFQSDLETTRVQASVPAQPLEISANNNNVSTDLLVDSTRIRVLYVEGVRQQTTQRPMPNGMVEIRGLHSVLYEALAADPDIDCVPLLALPNVGDFQSTIGETRGFPATRAQLHAFDAILLSDVSRQCFTDQQLTLIEDWVRERGAGLCMTGGPGSFDEGGWDRTVLADILPVNFSAIQPSWGARSELRMCPVPTAVRHPLWNIVADPRQNASILGTLPPFAWGHHGLSVKPSAELLAVGQLDRVGGDEVMPVVVAGSYGKGRVLAMSVSVNPQWSPEFTAWGTGDHRYYGKFCRNAVYWLTENSYLGRRRLVVTSDKMSYQPAETITLTARALDEISRPTTDCRVTAMIEPQSLGADAGTDCAPVRWPNDMARPGGESSPYVLWGEELDLLPHVDQGSYSLELPLSDRLTGGASAEALRIELSAYEHDVLIDSTSMDIQILDDPFEHRNPLPDLTLLENVAALSGGEVVRDARSLSEMMRQLPMEVGPEKVHTSPLWSRWWLLGLLLTLLTAEWGWRRNLGLA